MLDTVGSLLSWSVAPPALRAGLYEVATRIPGIRALGPAADASGRSGVALGVTADGIRYELIFDPDTAELLGQRQVLTTAPNSYGWPAGTTIDDRAITVTVVDHIGDQPTR